MSYPDRRYEAPILHRLNAARVFEIVPVKDGFDFYERCDGHFRLTLKEADVRQLITELTDMLEGIVPIVIGDP